MALGDKYATRAELQLRLGSGSTIPATLDTRLDDALSAASRGIEKACNRQFNVASSATSRVYEPCSTQLLEVDDISTTTGLVVKVDTAGDGTYATTVAATNYELRPLNGVVNGETGWPYFEVWAVNYSWPSWWQRAPLQVTATWGWAAVPAPVKEACLILAEELFKLADSPFGSGGYGQFGIIRARENPFCWQRIAPYARDRVLVG